MKRACLALAALLAAEAVHADPVSIGVFVAANLATSSAIVAVAAGWAAMVGSALALTVGLAKVSAALAGKPKVGAGVNSRRTMIRDATQPRTILYGAGRTSGVLVYINTSGSKNEYMDMVVAVAGHEISAIGDVWFDDDKILASEINAGAAAGGIVGSGNKYAARAWIYKYLGTDTQTASSTLDSSYVEWTSDHRGRGVAYVHIRLRRDNDVFTQGAPGNFTFTFQGAKVYDPRLDSTNGGTGTHRITDPSTWAYSNNPALCVADYIIGGSITNSATRVNLRGFGADPADVDWSSVIAAANVCDETVSIPDGSGGTTTQKRFECDGALSMGEYPAENLEQLLTSMMGQVTYSAGKYRLYAGVYLTPTLSLNESDLAGAIEYATGTSRSDRYNAVKGTRFDTPTGTPVEFLPRTASTYEAEDGGTRLYRDIELPFTTNEFRAQRIAQLILRRSREQATLIWRGNLGCLRVGVWETVQVTVAELGITNKVFRCLSREFKPQAEGGDPIVELTLREESSITYTDPLVADYGALNPSTPAATPSDFVNPTDDLSVVFDPEFTYAESIVLLYWDIDGTVSATSGGTVVLYPDGVTSPQVRTKHLRTFPVQLTSAWSLSFTVRYRVAAALTGSNHRAFLRVYATGEAWSDGQTLCDSQTLDLSTAVEGAWYTSQFSLDYAPDGTKDRCRVQLIVDAADVSDGEVEFDYCYGYRQNITVDPGDTVQPITGYLTNDSCTLAADSAGIVYDYGPAAGQFKVYQGITDVTSLATFAEVSELNIVATVNTAVNTPVPSQPRGYYRATNVYSAQGVYVMSATYEGVTITKTFTVSKSLSGADGDPGSPGVSPLTMSLSRPSVSLLAYANGTVQSYATAEGFAKVYSGTTDVTSSAVLSAVASGVTGTVNSATGSPVGGQAKGYYRVTAMAGSAGTLSITATYSGQSVSADFAVTKTGIGYEIVSSLPTTGNFDGRMVYLSTDGKLYRYVGDPGVGGAWTAAVPVVDLLGQITTTQISDSAISTPKLQANAVYANNIAANQINTNHILAGAVTTDRIQAGAITAALIASNQITAAKIVAGTITANEIGDLAITTGKLAQAVITEAKIGDLQVGTIKIANSAVTESAVDDSNLGGGTIPTYAGNWTAVPGASVTMTNIPSAGARVRIDLVFNASAYGEGDDVTIGIRRQDGTFFAGPTCRLRANNLLTINSWSFVDSNPLAGAIDYAFYIWTATTMNAGKWYEIRLVGTVLKK